MTDAEKTKLIQAEINFHTPMAKEFLKTRKISTALIGGIVCLGLLSSMDTPLKENDDKVKALAGILCLAWCFLRVANAKINAQTRLIYESLRANEETELEPETTYNMIKNTGLSMMGTITAGASFLVPIIAYSMDKINSGTASAACASIWLAKEFYNRHYFCNTNLLLKNKLPKGVILPNLSKKKQHERD